MRNTKERAVRNAIGISLFKMIVGLSNTLLPLFLGFNNRRIIRSTYNSTDADSASTWLCYFTFGVQSFIT